MKDMGDNIIKFPISNFQFPIKGKRIIYYIKLWLLMSKNSFLGTLAQKKLMAFFLIGKIVRYSFFIFFLYFLLLGTESLAGYSTNEVIFFYLTFTLITTLSQLIFREVYKFRQLVVTGDLDLILVKPYSTLFRVLAGGADFIDLIVLPFLIFAIYYVGRTLSPTNYDVLIYVLLVVNGILLSMAFYIAVLAMALVTLEIDHTIMIYRDIENLARLPVDIYREPIKSVLTFIIPLGIMVTLPAKSFIGLANPVSIFIAFGICIVAVYFSLKLWTRALKNYASASS